MTKKRFDLLCDLCFDVLQESSPIDTGNLRYNAIKREDSLINGEAICEIYVDEDIAPYMPYTNEKWEHKIIKMGNFKKGEVVERFRDWDNPNEGWFDKAAEKIIKSLKEITGGKLID